MCCVMTYWTENLGDWYFSSIFAVTWCMNTKYLRTLGSLSILSLTLCVLYIAREGDLAQYCHP